ncbi:hypothetical protein ACW7BJ_33680 [Azospirillum argentinense]
MDMQDEEEGFRAQLGRRIGETVDRYPTKSAAAQAANISVDQLNRWINGTGKVSVEGLWGLARGVDVDFGWLCAGERAAEPIPAVRVFQVDVLRDVLAAMATVIADEQVTFDPNAYPELVFDLHDYVIDQRARQGAETADLSGITRIISLATRSKR